MGLKAVMEDFPSLRKLNLNGLILTFKLCLVMKNDNRWVPYNNQNLSLEKQCTTTTIAIAAKLNISPIPPWWINTQIFSWDHCESSTFDSLLATLCSKDVLKDGWSVKIEEQLLIFLDIVFDNSAMWQSSMKFCCGIFTIQRYFTTW